MRGNLSSAGIEEILTRQFVGRIGCHSDGLTYVVPLSYSYHDGCIYGRTLEGLKISMMRKNPKVCFQVDEVKDMANWKSVIAWGTFEELTNSPEREAALEILSNRMLPLVSSVTTHFSPEWPFQLKEIDSVEGVMFRIRLYKKTGRFEDDELIDDLLPG
jgi:uncharacterized protein